MGTRIQGHWWQVSYLRVLQRTKGMAFSRREGGVVLKGFVGDESKKKRTKAPTLHYFPHIKTHLFYKNDSKCSKKCFLLGLEPNSGSVEKLSPICFTVFLTD